MSEYDRLIRTKKEPCSPLPMNQVTSLARFVRQPGARLLALILLSLLVHMTILFMRPWWPTAAPAHDLIIDAVLVAAPTAPKVDKPKRVVPPAHHVTHHAAAAPAVVSQAETPQDSEAAMPPASGDGAENGPSGTPGPQAASDAAPTAAVSTPVVPSAPPASAPQAAVLRYDVSARDPKGGESAGYVGVGSITFTPSESAYSIDLEAKVQIIFFTKTVLEQHSEGANGATGLVPTRFSETRGGRTREARFDPASAPAGAQDRLSIVVQLGALLRANASLARAGAQIDVPLGTASNRFETWHFESRGLETLNTEMGKIDCVHLARSARPGSNDRDLDTWVALDHGSYPVRILVTEPDHTYVDMRLTRIETASDK